MNNIIRNHVISSLLLFSILLFSLNNSYAETVSYTYDSLSRLITAGYDDGQIDYFYDPSGNITQIDIQIVDPDIDGYADNADNCKDTFNPGQQDTDLDGYGNMCDADLDNDGVVGFNDYNFFGNAWGSDDTRPNWNPDADFDSDGVVGFNDYNIFGSRWGTSEPWH